MRGRGLAYRDVEELLSDQEEAVDAPTDPPRPPPPQEEAADMPEDQSRSTPPPVEQADRPIIPNEMVFLQIHGEEAAREAPPVLVDPPRTGDTTRGGRVTSSSKPPSTIGT